MSYLWNELDRYTHKELSEKLRSYYQTLADEANQRLKQVNSDNYYEVIQELHGLEERCSMLLFFTQTDEFFEGQTDDELIEQIEKEYRLVFQEKFSDWIGYSHCSLANAIEGTDSKMVFWEMDTPKHLQEEPLFVGREGLLAYYQTLTTEANQIVSQINECHFLNDYAKLKEIDIKCYMLLAEQDSSESETEIIACIEKEYKDFFNELRNFDLEDYEEQMLRVHIH